jgi:hypothetical protein
MSDVVSDVVVGSGITIGYERLRVMTGERLFEGVLRIYIYIYIYIPNIYFYYIQLVYTYTRFT